MNARHLKSDLLLLLTALIWGFAFVAQRVGMAHVGPFTYNAVRFALGALSLLPLILIRSRGRTTSRPGLAPPGPWRILWGGALAGVVLFTGASLQQIGMITTTSGKAGFITGLYVVLVPLMGLIWRQAPELGTWLGALLAAGGLYLLSITEDFTIAPGDLLVLVGAFFWACHVHIIGWLTRRIDPLKIAFLQFAVCSLLSLFPALVMETITVENLRLATLPILYGGLLSVGVAYTLQVVAQQDAHPAHAAILLSLETVFAALGGWLLLNETLSGRSLGGCALMLSGMLLSQFPIKAARVREAVKTLVTSSG